VVSHFAEPRGQMFCVLEISSKSSTHSTLLGGGVDADEDQISLLDGLVDVGREEEVATARLADNLLETWLVDG